MKENRPRPPAHARALPQKSLRERATFHRLDEPAVSWTAPLDELEQHLKSPAETERRRKELTLIFSSEEFRGLAISQLKVGIGHLRYWERHAKMAFEKPGTGFVVERVLLQLSLVAKELPAPWPELESVINEYRAIQARTARLRFALMTQPAPNDKQ